MIEITQYSSEMSHLWDNHVRNSRNGTFLHERGFMDYHRDRFADCSLLAVDQSRRLVAVLPANREGDVLCSHRGLSYGGWLMSSRHCDAAVMLEVMHATRQWMTEHRISTLIYKPVPHIYHRYPADDDVYALWRCGAQLSECSISSTIDLNCPLAPDRGNKSGMSRALRAGVSVGASSDWSAYWQVLSAVLQERHGTSPVHTLDEIMLLHSRFPDNIKLYTATAHDRVVAGDVFHADHGPRAVYSLERRRARAARTGAAVLASAPGGHSTPLPLPGLRHLDREPRHSAQHRAIAAKVAVGRSRHAHTSI